jgi:hypothetical protein
MPTFPPTSNDVPQVGTVFNEATPALFDTTVITGIIDRITSAASPFELRPEVDRRAALHTKSRPANSRSCNKAALNRWSRNQQGMPHGNQENTDSALPDLCARAASVGAF